MFFKVDPPSAASRDRSRGVGRGRLGVADPKPLGVRDADLVGGEGDSHRPVRLSVGDEGLIDCVRVGQLTFVAGQEPGDVGLEVELVVPGGEL